jgi:hypothetical protein
MSRCRFLESEEINRKERKGFAKNRKGNQVNTHDDRHTEASVLELPKTDWGLRDKGD